MKINDLSPSDLMTFTGLVFRASKCHHKMIYVSRNRPELNGPASKSGSMGETESANAMFGRDDVEDILGWYNNHNDTIFCLFKLKDGRYFYAFQRGGREEETSFEVSVSTDPNLLIDLVITSSENLLMGPKFWYGHLDIWGNEEDGWDLNDSWLDTVPLEPGLRLNPDGTVFEWNEQALHDWICDIDGTIKRDSFHFETNYDIPDCIEWWAYDNTTSKPLFFLRQDL